MYISTLENVFKNASKVMLDAEGGNNMMYLPIDKLIEQTSASTSVPATTSVPSGATTSSSSTVSGSTTDASAASRSRLTRDNFDRR